ncbi:MAG: hypothetical protein FJ221_12835, partial [Lentisphaerae bacterium]|nr:hypothetical protein [Lentisphaerota bacterium]
HGGWWRRSGPARRRPCARRRARRPPRGRRRPPGRRRPQPPPPPPSTPGWSTFVSFRVLHARRVIPDSGASGQPFREDDADGCEPPGRLFRLMKPDERARLFANTARAMGDAPEAIKVRPARHPAVGGARRLTGGVRPARPAGSPRGSPAAGGPPSRWPCARRCPRRPPPRPRRW